MKYTKQQIEDLKSYLGFCIKEGGIDDDYAKELIDKKKWEEIEELRAKADYYADAISKGEIYA